jgi:hypothetical protein
MLELKSRTTWNSTVCMAFIHANNVERIRGIMWEGGRKYVLKSIEIHKFATIVLNKIKS